MATIFFTEPELVVGHGRRVLFVNPNDLQIFKEIELPPDLGLKAPSSAEQESCPSSGQGPGKEQQLAAAGAKQPEATASGSGAAKVEVPTVVQNVAYSPDRQLLAVTTNGTQKALLLYRARPENARLLSARPLARAASALRFCSDSSSVLVTDKTGDCYQYDCVEVEATPRLLLGHLSVVYDILWSEDQQHIITCDRDDKIRVTNYPATFDIHSYCLGHKEFVSGLALLTDQHIASASGDKTLRVWNYIQGKEVLRHELPAPAVRLLVRQLEPERIYQAAVLFYDHVDALGLYRLERSSDETWSVTGAQMVRAEAGSWNISNFTLTADRIYVTGAENDRLSLRVYDIATGQRATNGVPEGWLEMVLEGLGASGEEGLPFVPEDLSVWFKKRFDNVSDYLERKKRRIEEQQQQKCG
ncbi:LOW QUALITY PROTEIN: tRNA (guanine-N(7)-)-methyltransferase non-catalytic subunit wuho [Drosophila ficusphila]|uniref:LOW QUALITY PROTEIN: tRNA (guanine-N(7)-)-methyltransferase non-catalytic subunit wuho n=1 Tax=Drosophila ficusphila TaxID=30025 RepID=UPI001C8A8EBA|nr:LOW QUALITY PROTEIN: tRNA (guanine-N(7)-)-methyltransferase non-catalytic subunit wuho [Drosophila ficusphila]